MKGFGTAPAKKKEKKKVQAVYEDLWNKISFWKAQADP
jgi:hypothetical protein